MSVQERPGVPVLQLSEAEFDGLERGEQLAYLMRVLLEFERLYRKWLARERGLGNRGPGPFQPGR